MHNAVPIRDHVWRANISVLRYRLCRRPVTLLLCKQPICGQEGASDEKYQANNGQERQLMSASHRFFGSHQQRCKQRSDR